MVPASVAECTVLAQTSLSTAVRLRQPEEKLLPASDEVMETLAEIAAAKGKIVLLDTGVGEGGIRVRPVTVQFCYIKIREPSPESF